MLALFFLKEIQNEYQKYYLLDWERNFKGLNLEAVFNKKRLLQWVSKT